MAVNFFGNTVPTSLYSRTFYGPPQITPDFSGTGEHEEFNLDVVGSATLRGGGGDDRYLYVNRTHDIIEVPGGGIDTVFIREYNHRGYYQMPDNVENAEVWWGTAIFGNDSDNYIIGRNTYQFFNGGTGNDIFTGGGGGDMYVFDEGSGYDLITDFRVANDTLRLSGYEEFETFGDVVLAMEQVGADTVIHLSDTDAIKLQNVSVGALRANNFQLHSNEAPENLTLTFSEEFDGTAVDFWTGPEGTWRTDYGWGATSDSLLSRTLLENNERQVYIDPGFVGSGTAPVGVSPFSISDGAVTIRAERATPETAGNIYGYQYTSGMLSTRNSFAQTYGYFEASIAIPGAGATGTWPAFWLYSEDAYQETSIKFELDVLEAWGDEMVQATIHTSDSSVPGGEVFFQTFDADLSQGFHRYGVLWTEETITWYIDGVEVGTVPTPADAHGPMYLIVNLALSQNTPANFDSAEMQVDYVRAYQLNALPASLRPRETPMTLQGTSQNDLHYVYHPDDLILESATGGRDTVVSVVDYALGANLEVLQLRGNALGGSGNALGNTLLGNDWPNTLHGGPGNDWISGGAGADSMYGGPGDDQYVVDGVGDRVYENPGGGTDTVMSYIEYFALGANVENLMLYEDAIEGHGNGLANRIIGNAQSNRLYGHDGNDTLDGGLGYDSMYGGRGNDTYYVDHPWDVVTEYPNEGTDLVYSGINYVLPQNVESIILTGDASYAIGNILNNVMKGNALNNYLEGQGGDDVLDGGLGADEMVGGAGNDYYIVDNVGDRVIETANAGRDTVESSVDYTLGAHVENLILTGSAITGRGNELANTLTGNAQNNVLNGMDGNDTIDGGPGDDTLLGGNGDDRISGGTGNDVIFGQQGNDILYGGAGADVFAFEIADIGTGLDHIADFNPLEGDKIGLSGVLSGFDPQTDSLASYIHFFTSGANTFAYVDLDGPDAANAARAFVYVPTSSGITLADISLI